MKTCDLSWTVSSDKVHAFGTILVAAGEIDTCDELLYYFEKPHKWAPEHDLWLHCDEPDPHDDDKTGWYWFLGKLAQR